MDWGRCINKNINNTVTVTGIIQCVDMSISKTTLKNFKEVKFCFLLEFLHA